ncbi:Segregation and condensation protein A [Austwickia sp. TVS 96-490-7B]|uniref:segregation and condensation protein A n=1 Tax=Austwickia sp. TVS 96-490-7B TaxID=2830843 RepID=UPI001DE4E1ED|nr:ScpA family protein [Austwickia sp. TVS 96-490-7B]MBW3086293.1 Segregation and condensation protein A [Austwickia sp. TVS 96-490-7B]
MGASTAASGSAGGTLGAVVPGGVLTKRGAATPFEVHLDQFDGPFDLLLGLIGQHHLDVTEIALARVTDEFMAHLRRLQQESQEWDLSETTEFLLVAATLLELKAARLLPRTGEEDEDLELIEARDLLFARLLQYRAFKDVSAVFAERMSGVGRIFPRQAGLEQRFAALLPELTWRAEPEAFARTAAVAMTPKMPPTVQVEHLHAARVSVQEQSVILIGMLRRVGASTFVELVRDAESTLVVVARFLVVLELFRDGAVVFEQGEALGALTVQWIGGQHVDEVLSHRLGREYDDTVDAEEGLIPGD